MFVIFSDEGPDEILKGDYEKKYKHLFEVHNLLGLEYTKPVP